MKTVLLIHGLYMNSLSFYFMKKELEKNNEWHIDTFNYNSFSFDEKILENLNKKINSYDSGREIVIVAHSMGGLVTRLYLNKYKPERNIKVITLGTPHQSSALAKKISENCVVNKILGQSLNSSFNTGLTKPIENWDGSYPVVSIAGIKNLGLLQILSKKLKEPSDGTVFVQETTLPFAKHVTIDDTHHMQLITSKKSIELVKKYI